VVVVNDDPSQLRLIAGIIQRDDAHVRAFEAPEEALRSLRADPGVDLFVVDLHMPVIDGWRFCRLLRSPEFAAFNTTPILVVSATFAGADVEAITADLGANAFLPVPFPPDRLLACARDLLAGHTPQAVQSVLVVEDDDAVRDSLEKTFERHGYVVRSANSAEEGRRLMWERRPDVLLIDYHLPNATARDFLREVQRPGDPMVSIVMTGDPDPDLPVTVLREGASAYVRKPFDPAYLVDLAQKSRRERALLRVEEILEGRTQQLRASEERYRSLFAMIPEMVLILDRDARILQANEAAVQFVDRETHHLAGMPVYTLVPERLHEATTRRLERCWTEGGGTFEGRVARGSVEVPVEVNTKVVEFEGTPALLTVSRDVSERRRLEQERRVLEARNQHAQKLESLGVLAGGIAHDFNNLLMGVLGNASLALSDLSPRDPAWESIKQIEVAARRAAELTGQILTYSGKGPVVMKPMDLSDVVREMAKLLQPAVTSKARVEYSLDSDLPAVSGDASQVRQVVMNLIMNASDALGDSPGTIRVRTAVVDPDHLDRHANYLGDDTAEGPYVLIEVSDDGCGLDEDQRKRMFDPFFTTKFKGRGLGLSTVMGIVRSHKGGITVDSEPGRGTTVRVYLPVSGERLERRARPAEKPSLDWGGAGAVLVIDDEPAVRNVVRMALEKAGFEAILAEDGSRGLELFREYHDDIRAVLLDLSMPGLSGDEVLERIRAEDESAVVILSSGYAEERVLERLHGLGISGFLQKPYHPGALLQLLEQLLDRTAATA